MTTVEEALLKFKDFIWRVKLDTLQANYRANILKGGIENGKKKEG